MPNEARAAAAVTEYESNTPLSAHADQLAREIRHFHHHFWGKEPPPTLVTRYVDAHQFCCKERVATVDIEKIVALNLDPEAIEYATRAKSSTLTKKLTLYSYLLELESAYFQEFFNSRSQRVVGWISLGWSVCRSVALHIKGSYLVWRYTLV